MKPVSAKVRWLVAAARVCDEYAEEKRVASNVAWAVHDNAEYREQAGLMRGALECARRIREEAGSASWTEDETWEHREITPSTKGVR